MQCISAERSIGFCSTVEASERVVERAYAICNGRPNAARPTHLTITATLVLDPSGRGVVTFPPVTKLSTTSSLETSSTTQSLPTTLVIDTSSAPTIPRPSTRTRIRSTTKEDLSTDSPEETNSASENISISEPPFTRSTTFETTTSTSTSETETTTGVSGGAGGTSKDQESDDSDKLSTEQIAGISVGVLAAVGVAVGAIVLARYCRRKKYPHVKTGFLPMRDTWGYKADRSDNGGHNSWMVHQLRPDLDPGTQAPPPPAYNRANARPENIGVALSPPSSNRNTVNSSPLRRLSKLLPAKPTLPHLSSESTSEKPLPPINPEPEENGQADRGASPQLPQPALTAAAVAASSPRSRPMPPKLHIPPAGVSAGGSLGTNNRESNVTEFEEDRTSMSPNNVNTQVWRPPPTTPLSATTYYVADQYGNWILGNPKRASVIARGSQDSNGSQGGAPKPPSKDDNGSLGNMGQTSARTLAPPAEIFPASAQNKPYGSRPQYPSPFFSSQSHPRRSASSRRSITRPLTRPREDSSSSSATIITTSTESSASIPSVTLEQQVSLSPVAESPQSVRVRQQQQQQQQPQIPPRDPRRASQMGNPGDNVNTRLAPPSRKIFYSPPGQPSPTLGMMQPPSAYNSARQQPGSQNTPTIPNVGLETTSPTMRIVEPSPEPEDTTTDPPAVQPDQIRASPFYFDPPYPQPLQAGQQSQSQHRRSTSGSQPQTYRPYQRPPSFQPSPHEQQAAWQPIQRLHFHHHQQCHQPQQQPQHNMWHPTQRAPQSYQSFQQQPPLQAYQRPPHSSIYQQQPNMYQSFQARQSQQPQPHSQGGYQSFQPYSAPQQAQIHPSQYQNYRPPQPMTTALAHSGSQDSLLSKRVGSDRAADMTIGTDSAKKSKWNRDVQDNTPPSYPMSPHWKPTLTPTRRGDDLVLNVQ
ncbi:def1-coordinates repair and rna pol ii proteolysis in response to dna damage [Fusarium langsethiae]|uniref:Def1-coordinates repair and rna pol ii proteolysis in response to dna damage n=1 Tax=Fusarium langsethiae TaxID=179993 RepID=A0A0M9F1L0_FUSLA|nr:def1-coordinates repair and rna pol ii proteolysis in response to dna damage [Fusarium langsethiae]GKT99753.1 unnamed protein product [Fusarium langsethiae]GKU14200.1 unnamed protein product [Fusarium langsethiae]